MGPRAILGVPGEDKTLLSLPGIEPWLPDGPPCILGRTPPGLFGSCWFRTTWNRTGSEKREQ